MQWPLRNMVCLASGVVILSESPNFKELAAIFVESKGTFSVGKPLPLLSFNETTLFRNLEFYMYVFNTSHQNSRFCMIN